MDELLLKVVENAHGCPLKEVFQLTMIRVIHTNTPKEDPLGLLARQKTTYDLLDTVASQVVIVLKERGYTIPTCLDFDDDLEYHAFLDEIESDSKEVFAIMKSTMDNIPEVPIHLESLVKRIGCYTVLVPIISCLQASIMYRVLWKDGSLGSQ